MTSATAEQAGSEPQPAISWSLWSAHLKLLAIAALAIVAIFWRDGADIVRTWWNISTYNHCLLIVPILYYLVQQRQEELAKFAPEIWLPGLLLTGIA